MESVKKSTIQEERFNSQSNTTTPSTSGPSATANEAGVSTSASASGGISGSSSGEHFATSKSKAKVSTPTIGDTKYKRPMAPKINITSASETSKRSAMRERSIFATPSTLTSTPSSTETGKGVVNANFLFLYTCTLQELQGYWKVNNYWKTQIFSYYQSCLT